MTDTTITTPDPVIRGRTIKLGVFVEIQKRGKGTAIETARVTGWAVDSVGPYLLVYGGRTGYLRSFTARPEHVVGIPNGVKQTRLDEERRAMALPKPRARRAGGR